MTDVNARLAAARASGDREALALALVDHAAALLTQGELAVALADLDESREIYVALGRTHEQAKCLHLSATVCRLLADLDGALDRARRAEQLADAATPARVAAIMEQGEVAAMRGPPGDAADHFGRALAEGRAAGLVPDYQARLLRKRAKMLAGAGRFAEAVTDAREGRALHEESGTLDEARRAMVELAVVQEQAAAFGDVTATLAETRAVASAVGDHHVLADVELLAAGRAAADRNLAEALACARKARQHALDAVAPLSYVSAVVTISELADAMGDRHAAYEALASGWVTTGDVIGEQAAKELFEPRLKALRDAWGAAAFVAVRDAYNDRRRAVLRGDAS